MKYFGTHRNALNFVKTFSTILTIWPVDKNVGKFKYYSYKSLRWFFTVFCLMNIPTFLAGLYYSYGDYLNFMKSMAEMIYLCEVSFNFIWCIVEEPRLQVLIREMEEFKKIATPQQMAMRNKYLKGLGKAYPVVTTIFVVGAWFFILSPAVTKRTLPLNAIYYLPVEEEYWAKCLAYGMNNLAITLSMNTIVVDYMLISMISFASFKFEYVAHLFRSASNRKVLRKCVIKHLDALRFVKEIKISAHLVVSKLIAAASMNMIACNLLILNNVRFFEMIQFLLITVICSMRLYMVSWACSVMIDTNNSLRVSVYDSPWINNSIEMRQDIIIILHICQTPVVINVLGLTSEISLRFYSIVLYKVCSYFMTLRAILRV